MALSSQKHHDGSHTNVKNYAILGDIRLALETLRKQRPSPSPAVDILGLHVKHNTAFMDSRM